ncbi:DUF6443 domain-containing protein [Flavobacterium microcysteis]|nr:DUF6443 domain-containing protein [Flavobacterium microcysteis]
MIQNIKILRACLLLALAPAAAMAQTATQNYTKTTTYREAGNGRPAASITYFDGLGRPIQQLAHQMSPSGKDIVTHIEYDASGKKAKEFLPYPSQSVPLGYDPNAATEVSTFYASPSLARTGNPNFEATGNPYTEKQFEASPLGRVLKQAAPGSTWKMPESPTDTDHTIRTEYLSNSAIDAVKLYKATNGILSGGYYPASLSQQGTYPAGALYKTLVKDENWTISSGNSHTMQEFKNKEGQIVLKRVWGSSIVNNVSTEGWHDTYYVYDNYGNLAFVLPPLSDGSGSQADLNGLCYQYRYDERKRLVEKRLPGKQWEFIVYDNLDRIIATGPARSPFNNMAGAVGWLFTKYDAFGRIAYTGWMQANVTSLNRNTLQADRNAQTTNLSEAKTVSDNSVSGVTFRYTNQTWPTGSGWHILSVNYYDNYDFPGAPTGFADVEGQPVYYNLSVLPKGLPTGSWTRVLEVPAVVNGELSYTLYDYKARPIRTHMLNHMGGYTQADAKLNFSGKILYTVTGHKRTGSDSPIIVREDFTYSSQDRLLTRSQKIGNRAAELLSQNTYDELGQLISKKTGGSALVAPLQKVDYAYNVRGWLKEINDTGALAKQGDPADLFAFKINYENPLAAQPQFNGNISETYWRTANDNILRRYAYQFDSMGRLTSASYHKPESVSAPDSYKESQQYDKNGNIRKLQRFGEFDDAITAMMVDDLDYTYQANSNKIAKVTDHTGSPAGFRDDIQDTNDSEDDYNYDSSGNMTFDQNKNIDQIVYNHLNLPIRISFAEGAATIEYLYNAGGKKLRKTVTESPNVKTQEYLDGFDYANGTLEAIHTAEGYVKATSDGTRPAFNYIYNYKDHLGNIRLSYTKDPVSEQVVIIEENNYYPFGLTHKNYNTTKRMYDRMGGGVIEFCPGCPLPYSYNYKFNGKEFQEELGLNVTAMDFRQYDNALGRFNGMDALAEIQYSRTPYHFGYGNPVYWTDPSGLLSDTFIRSIWDNSASTGWTYWNNSFTGYFSDNHGKGTVDTDTGIFTPSVSLDEVEVTLYRGNTIGASYILQEHVYDKSKYYEQLRSERNEKRWRDFAGGLQNTGDLISAAGFLISVTGVGLPLGGALMSLGGVVSGIGTGIEIATDISYDKFSVSKTIVKASLQVLPSAYNKIVPNSAFEMDNALIEMGSTASDKWIDYTNELNSKRGQR